VLKHGRDPARAGRRDIEKAAFAPAFLFERVLLV
jgi:hypothetical protein